MVERDVTLVLMGWTGDVPIRSNVFGSLLDEVVWRAPIPVAVARLTTPVNAIRRVVLGLPHHPLGPALIRQTLALVVPLANALKAPLLVVSGAENLNTTDPDGLAEQLDQGITAEPLHGELAGELAGRVDARDLVVMSTLGPQGRFRITLGSAGHSSAPEKLAAQSACSIIVVHYP
jgi:nucleotide-binding universal stress UspA family protein